MPSERGRRLLHPVYLDVPMMVSFLAALRDGVSFEDETTRRSAGTTDREREVGAKVRIPSLVSLLGFDASGRMGFKDHGEEAEEVRAVRQHTASSLFMALHEALSEDGLVREVNREEDLAGIQPGDVIEVSGEFIGNPLQEVLGFFAQAMPYFDITLSQEEPDVESIKVEVQALIDEAESLRDKATKGKRSGNPGRQGEAGQLERDADEAEERANELLATTLQTLGERQQQMVGVQMLTQMSEDLKTAPVHDTVIKGSGLQAVLTLSAEFFTDATSAYLRAGEFRALGKVTRVLREDDETINLLRRSVLGAGGAELGRSLLENAVKGGELDIETVDPIIHQPAVQVLPLAVYT